MPTSYWSVFKNFEKTSYIDKSDQQKSELLIVPSLCLFSAFAISTFMRVEVAAHFLVLKMSRNLSENGKLRNHE